ncbi:ATP-NAD kinase [Thermococcus sp. M39]|uniref:ATP-NAD kinase family protein n=1 Tax=unclassified Thermococcus TaxID=2627626 RepID=UPI00143ABB9F|nr:MULTISPECIES: ATP-NAD kinase family protein [unclassified Thermococcus]NJE07087.1 ATP-NAD kinase [Thermococcus sp. M39]NJE13625.1 ATP-NAD kinase [Thermococcus sp. LS2]
MKVGLIINPIAGMGGKVALKGTDGVVEEAIRRGAKPIALDLAKLFLSELSQYEKSKGIEFLTGPKELGEYALREFDFPYQVIKHREIGYRDIFGVRIPDTTNEDTKTLAKLMADKVGILVFAGGDGTARDVYSAVDKEVPILGIPTGVKMFSGVFASSPEDAAKLLIEFIKGDAEIVEREILDLDEDAYRRDEVKAKLYGTALTPYVETLVQGSKEPTKVDESEELEALAEAIVEELEDGIYFLGAGSTVKRIKDKLGIDGTLLGVDIVEIQDGRARLLVKDAQEKDLLKFIDKNPKIIVTVVGGVNFLFGRGNQQFSADVLRHIPKENIIVVATPSKVERPIRVYTGDKKVDEKLKGYMRVRIGAWRERMVKVI